MNLYLSLYSRLMDSKENADIEAEHDIMAVAISKTELNIIFIQASQL